MEYCEANCRLSQPTTVLRLDDLSVNWNKPAWVEVGQETHNQQLRFNGCQWPVDLKNIMGSKFIGNSRGILHSGQKFSCIMMGEITEHTKK